MSQGLVVIPTDSATAGQRARYAAYVEARTPRTASPQGPARMMVARDLLGSSGQIAEALYAHAGFREVREEPACPNSSRSQSRSPPDRRLSSEPGTSAGLPTRPSRAGLLDHASAQALY